MIGIIGGTGVYSLEGIEIVRQETVQTPFGDPSAPLIFARYGDQELVFLSRHGADHKFLPHEVNYRANIWALKSAGVLQVVGISAVGSLQHDLKPGDFVIPSQYFDFVKGQREKTFFGNGLAAHVSTAQPTCPNLTNSLKTTADKLGMVLHTGKTYGCVDGPRLGTIAESNFLRTAAGCDLVGMTNVPEAFLAREAQICYCTIGVITDYDCWLEDPEEHVTVADVIARYGQAIEKVKTLLKEFLSNTPPEIDPLHREILQYSVLSSKEHLSQENIELLELLSN